MVHLGCETTLENIKVCKKHFNVTDMDCDILAGERGPSFTDVSQISNWKVLHIRLVARSSESFTSVSDVVRSILVNCETATSLRAPQPSKVPAFLKKGVLI